MYYISWLKRVTLSMVIVVVLTGSVVAAPRALPAPIYGVTLTDPWQTEESVASLAALKRKAMARIVFDEWVAAEEYEDIPQRIHAHAYTMGLLLDSYYVKDYSLRQYEARAREYVEAFGSHIDLWEVGNEVNGEWLGESAEVQERIHAAYRVVKERGGKTALTLYYNEGCYEKPEHEMFAWVQAHIPESMKQGLDYVWVSYYEDDCNGLQPNWQKVFERLGAIFPTAKLGIGECGTEKPLTTRKEYLRRYYTMRVSHPRYVGGYFWWYFNRDMTPTTAPLWKYFNTLLPAP